jgi:hypothetical protein
MLPIAKNQAFKLYFNVGTHKREQEVLNCEYRSEQNNLFNDQGQQIL